MKPLTIYVRAPQDATRSLSFERIPELSTKEALDAGLAIDGNSFVVEVTAYFENDEEPRGMRRLVPLTEALLDQERELVALVEKKGYEVTFK